MSEIRFKIAEDLREREQVHRLHYQAFVEEIPQYARNDERRLVDRFDDQNTYIVAMDGDVVVGSIAVRGERPFSLDQKLPDLDGYLPAGHRFCEIRLLSVLKQHRRGNVLPGLIAGAWNHAMAAGYDGALISGTTRQLKLYAHLGFVPFGPLVGTAVAAFQPMYVTKSGFAACAQTISSLPPGPRGELANLLTGPVAIHDEVVAAFSARPQSHRSASFESELRQLRGSLCALVHAEEVEVLLGTGTLANDAVAAQLSLLETQGLVLSNGEFGERLVDHAMRAGLGFEHMRVRNVGRRAVTIALPDGIRSDDVAAKMESAGFLIGHASAYLRNRNWIQLCLMGGVPWQTLRQACRTLRMIVDSAAAKAG